MKTFVWLSAMVVAVFFVAARDEIETVLADEEYNCAYVYHINACHWTGPPPAYPLPVNSVGTTVNYDDHVFWCYEEEPDFGSFAYEAMPDNVVEESIEFSPAYYYPTTHYGILEVNVTATLATAADGAMVTTVNQVWPYNTSDRDVEITYVPE